MILAILIAFIHIPSLSFDTPRWMGFHCESSIVLGWAWEIRGIALEIPSRLVATDHNFNFNVV